MTNRFFDLRLLGIALTLSPLSSVQAQNGTLIGGNSFAAECYRASQVASSTGSANRLDLESCDRAILDAGLKPKDLIATYVNRGVVYMAMGNRKQALADLNRALALDDNTGEAYVNRGNLWFVSNNLSKAVVDYNLALELGVEKPHVAHLNRGMAQEQLGQLEAAKSDYQAALSYLKDWSQAVTRLERVEEKLVKKRASSQQDE